VSFTKIKLTLCSNFVLTANLASIIGGAAYSWTSPVLPKLNNVDNMVDNPFGRPITPFEESWITSIISVGAAIGPLLAATVMDRIGRKKTMLMIAIPMIVSHLILAFTTSINLYYFSRFFLGIGAGCVYSVVPTYVGEIAENSNRGAFGCMMGLVCTAGTLFCYIIGPFVTIKTFCLILVVPPVVFFHRVWSLRPRESVLLVDGRKRRRSKTGFKKNQKIFSRERIRRDEEKRRRFSFEKCHFKRFSKIQSHTQGIVNRMRVNVFSAVFRNHSYNFVLATDFLKLLGAVSKRKWPP
jgi:MFS family permease